MLATDHSLNDAVLNLPEQKLVIVTHQLKSLPERVDAPLGSCSIVRGICVVLKVRIELVQTIVRQMHVLLLPQIPISTLIVLLSGKTGQAILIDIEAQRIYRSHRNVDAHIELVAIDEQWLAHVLAHDHLGPLRDLIHILRNKNAFTLRRGGRFANPGHIRFLDHRILQLEHLSRQDESFGQEFEMALTYTQLIIR